METRRALGALTVLGVGLLASLATVSSAEAVPPTTVPDAVTVYQGNFAPVFPINNDADADNDLVTVCRLGTENHKGIEVGFFGDEVDFAIGPRTKPGVYTFTYYACDFQTLVPGTISVTVQELPDITVTPQGAGRIKVKNPFPFRIRFLYGSFKEGGPDGIAKVPAGGSAVVRVERTKIDWIADAKRGTVYCGTGHVKGIKQRSGARPTVLTGDPRLADTWRTAP